jgi:hypothetical protein
MTWFHLLTPLAEGPSLFVSTLKFLAVLGAAFLGGFLIGLLVQALARLLSGQKIPPPFLQLIRLLAAVATGLLVWVLIKGDGGPNWGGGAGGNGQSKSGGSGNESDSSTTGSSSLINASNSSENNSATSSSPSAATVDKTKKQLDVMLLEDNADGVGSQASGAKDRLFQIDRSQKPQTSDELKDALLKLRGKLQLTENSQDALRSAGVPQDVLEQLKTLRGKKFATKKLLADELHNILAQVQINQWQDVILNHAERDGTAPNLESIYLLPQGPRHPSKKSGLIRDLVNWGKDEEFDVDVTKVK